MWGEVLGCVSPSEVESNEDLRPISTACIASSISKPSSASITIHRVPFILSPNITCPPQVLPQHVSCLSTCVCLADITLPISPSPWKWQKLQHTTRCLLAHISLWSSSKLAQLHNVRQTNIWVLLAKNSSSHVHSCAFFGRTSFHQCLLSAKCCFLCFPQQNPIQLTF